MALNRWPIDKLLTFLGFTFLFILIIPTGAYLMSYITASAERNLYEHGLSHAETIGSQVVDLILTGDRLSLHDVLSNVAANDSDVRFICIEDKDGSVIAHTFHGGFPRSLQQLWKANRDQIIRFRTVNGTVIDISTPIVSGQLGYVHVGLSRVHAVKATYHLMWIMGVSLTGALMMVYIGAHLVAMKVSKPLLRLEAEVSQFPGKSIRNLLAGVSGTREVASLASSINDMATRLNSLEQERTVTQSRMIHTERLAALGELAAGLTHEIRNPLDGMLECVRYLEADQDKGKRQIKYLPMIRAGLERINNVMQQMLTYSRSGYEPSDDVSPTGDIMDSLELMLKGKIESKSIKLTWVKPGSCVCLCNKQVMLQVLLNLVLNAFEAVNTSKNPEVRVEAQCDTQWVYISVEDNGNGISETNRERIFDPFFTTKPRGKGTGLGLSISRQLVLAVGGELELINEPSLLGGARFVIRIPRIDQQGQNNAKCES